MKKIITFALLLISFPLSAQMRMNKPVTCFDTETLIRKTIIKDFEENPVWLGTNDDKNNFSLFINRTTGGWTLIEFKGKTACVLGAGDNSLLSQELK